MLRMQMLTSPGTPGRGFTKRGGQLMLGAHVERVLVEEKRAVGVQLRNGTVIRARKVRYFLARVGSRGLRLAIPHLIPLCG